VTETWNWVIWRSGTVSAETRPITRMPRMDSTHGPELMMPA